ncbi:MAG: hypothetical protein HKN47_11435 [Pirellulaceae bacterium]|nr:hypothetical protein [Pirellulaceae bacterium]
MSHTRAVPGVTLYHSQMIFAERKQMIQSRKYSSSQSLTHVRRAPSSDSRRGSVTVLASILMIVLLAMVAFAVDLGYIAMAKTEAQRTADAAAHAAALEYSRSGDAESASGLAHELASNYSQSNLVLSDAADVEADADVVVGRYDFGGESNELQFDNPESYNAVKVRIRRTNGQNGGVPLFFGNVLGHDRQDVITEATAALIRNVSGFRSPASGENVPVLPITLSEDEWNAAMNGGGDDNWSYDSQSNSVSSGNDGVREFKIYPNDSKDKKGKKNTSSGNLGAVNIGVSNNSTSYLGNQIRNGLSKSDMNFHGGSLELDSDGELELSGNPGLSASIQKDLQAIIGQPRVMPIYRSVDGNGNNAVYTIVKFVCVRIMYANLSGNDKGVYVQPASMAFPGVIQGSTNGSSSGVYSPPRLVQ